MRQVLAGKIQARMERTVALWVDGPVPVERSEELLAIHQPLVDRKQLERRATLLAGELGERIPSFGDIAGRLVNGEDWLNLASAIEDRFRSCRRANQQLVHLVDTLVGIFRTPEKPLPVDLLGIYDSARATIVLYDRAIELQAALMGKDPAVVRLVVLAHEMAHAVTHLGKNIDGKPYWVHSDDATTALRESLAQFWAHRMLLRWYPDDAVKTFDALEAKAPPVYGLWRTLRHVSGETVRYFFGVAVEWEDLEHYSLEEHRRSPVS